MMVGGVVMIPIVVTMIVGIAAEPAAPSVARRRRFAAPEPSWPTGSTSPVDRDHCTIETKLSPIEQPIDNVVVLLDPVVRYRHRRSKTAVVLRRYSGPSETRYRSCRRH